MPKRLSHVRRDGSVRMVDVGSKSVTGRIAVAEAIVCMSGAAARALKASALKKGDALTVAQIAGIQAAKRTSELIPLAHSLQLAQLDVRCELVGSNRVRVECTARANGRTGVEMEALVGAATAALTIYDMCKALDRSITIENVRLLEKRGGKSGAYRRSAR